jgi:hypothetical protein
MSPAPMPTSTPSTSHLAVLLIHHRLLYSKAISDRGGLTRRRVPYLWAIGGMQKTPWQCMVASRP